MNKHDYRLKGHETFILREGWLTKGLQAVHDDAKVFSQNNGADALGVGTNMAKSIRYWLRAAGLTRESQKFGAELTELGEVLYPYDLYMEDIFSLWLIHVNLVQNLKLATSWNLFFNHIDVTTFKRDELFPMMKEQFFSVTGEQNLSESSLKADCTAILQMYADSPKDSHDPEDKKKSPFALLGLLSEVQSNLYEKKRPARDKIDPLLILYFIAERLKQELMIPIDEIVDASDMPGKILNLNRVAVNDYLDLLQNEGYLIVNRTAGLDMVYPDKLISPIEAIKEHYERSSPI